SLIARNTMALEAALQLANQLDVDAMLKMHHALLKDSDPDHAGRLREEAVWIGGQSPVTAMFVPPEHSTVPDALEDLVAFTQRPDGSGIGICDTALPRHNAELHCAFIVRAAHQHERLF